MNDEAAKWMGGDKSSSNEDKVNSPPNEAPEAGADEAGSGNPFEALHGMFEDMKRAKTVSDRQHMVHTLAHAIENLTFATGVLARLVEDAFPHPDDED